MYCGGRAIKLKLLKIIVYSRGLLHQSNTFVGSLYITFLIVIDIFFQNVISLWIFIVVEVVLVSKSFNKGKKSFLNSFPLFGRP